MTESMNAVQTATFHQATGSLLTFGIALERIALCLLENISGHYRLAAWETLPREAGIPPSHQCATLCQRLGERLGRPLWDETTNAPLLTSADPIQRPPIEHVTIGMSPRPRMRVWLVGLTESGSLAAARRALVSAPLQLIGATALTPQLTSTHLMTELSEAHPEALVLVGGYDTTAPEAQRWMLQLARLVSQALERLSPGQRPAVFYAGNRWCAEAVEAILRRMNGPIQVTTLANVLPAPALAQPAALGVALSGYYWRLCQQMPGIHQLQQWLTAPGRLLNLESAFAQMVQVWMEYQQLPALHGLYCLSSPASAPLRDKAQPNLNPAPRAGLHDWWLHVWADRAAQGVQLRFVRPGTRPAELADWPPLQVVSGDWPMELWPPPAHSWWDRQGLAPVITTLGQVAPTAVLQCLEHDILEPRRHRG